MCKLIPRVAFAAFLFCGGSAASAQSPSDHPDSISRGDTATHALPTIMIAGRKVSVPSRFEAAYKRAASGRGMYFTREEIEATNPRDLESLLLRVPTVQVNDRGVTFAKCQGGLPSRDQGAQSARVQVFIDNRRASLTSADDIRQVLNSISVSTVQLMEVYTGVSRIPAEFVNDACAVVVIWTKSY